MTSTPDLLEMLDLSDEELERHETSRGEIEMEVRRRRNIVAQTNKNAVRNEKRRAKTRG